MRKTLIESYVTQLKASFGPVRVPISEEELHVLYEVKNYTGMIRVIQKVLRLDLRVRMGLVKNGGPSAQVWIESPKPMPLYGTSAFRQTMVTIYLRKSFLQYASFEETVLALAHEFSHVVLNSMGHALREQEEVVDLTAMLLGFRDFYVTGCKVVRKKESSMSDTLLGIETYEDRRTGYLTPEEVRYAAEYMTFG